MPILSAGDADKLKAFFQDNLKDPVTVELFSQKNSQLVVPGQAECEYCAETEELLGEVAGLSDKITLNVHDLRDDPAAGSALGIGRDDVPAIVFQGENRGKVRSFGIPAGNEFMNLVYDLAGVSTGETKLTQATKDELAKLPADVHVRVFVTPTWPYCPSVARLAHDMAIVSERVTADVVEANEFPDLSNRFAVSGVPKIVINDTVELLGAQREARLVQAVVQAASA